MSDTLLGPTAHGGPLGQGRIRVEPEDFVVEELLGFEPDGAGQHVLLQVRKRGHNTDWVAGRLAAAAGVTRRAVGLSGSKDRHAVTTQWFTVDLAGRPEPDWSAHLPAGVEVLRAERHGRKLRMGSHRANRFTLRVRDCTADTAALQERLERLAAAGVPNYFGPQRFGRDGANLAGTRRWFAGEVRPRRVERGWWLSAARAHLFNRVLAERVRHDEWARCRDGEPVMLDGRGSIFVPGPDEPGLTARLDALEIHPTGPLWGRGEPAPTPDERRIVADDGDLCEGLEKQGLDAARRALRLRITEPEWGYTGGVLEYGFTLARGGFATAVLRELVSAPDLD